MNSKAIIIDNIGKLYRIDKTQEKHDTLRDALSSFFRKPLKRFQNLSGNHFQQAEEFWALRDVSFDIEFGDIVGIIGRNGAGKSTLLKILSRITTPTEGRIFLYGRVGSLLEVGTGFHPELSGRENIYMNGALLGLKKKEITQRFDDIVSFSEVEKFIDTPIKRYSSGMYVRLAFAVAAFMNQEILVIDEVLAVGDAAFQKKCLSKMNEESQKGRTILFVSHNMSMITALCKKVVLLQKGRMQEFGSVSDVVLKYYTNNNSSPSFFAPERKTQESEDPLAELIYGRLTDEAGHQRSEFLINESVCVEIGFRVKTNRQINYVPNFHFFGCDGSCVCVAHPSKPYYLAEGEYVARCVIPGNFFNDTSYSIGLAVTSYFESGRYDVNFYEGSALNILIKDDLELRNGYTGSIPGVVRPNFMWDCEKKA